MKIVLCGGGRTSQALIHFFSHIFDIVLIEKSKNIITQIEEHYDLRAIEGDATDPDILRQAELNKDTLLLISLGDQALNLFVSRLASQLFFLRYTVIRFYDDVSQEIQKIIQQSFHADLFLIHEKYLVENILEHLSFPTFLDYISLWDKNFFVSSVMIKEKSHLLGLSLNKLRKCCIPLNAYPFLLIRNYQVVIWDLREVVKEKDIVYFFALSGKVKKIQKFFNGSYDEEKYLNIIGVSEVTKLLLKKIPYDHFSGITVIDSEKERLESIASYQQFIKMVQGNFLDLFLQKSSLFSSKTYTLAISDDQLYNIVCSFLAQDSGSVITLTWTQQNFFLQSFWEKGKMIHFFQKLVNHFFSFFSGPHVSLMYPLQGKIFWILSEVCIIARSKAIGMNTSNLKEKGLHLIVLLRKKKIMTQNFVIKEADRVLLFFFLQDYKNFQDFFLI